MRKLIGMAAAFLLVVSAACGDGKQGTDQAAVEPGTEPAGDAAPGGDEEKIFDMPYLERDLDNGLRVIIVPTDYPDIVTIQIPVQTGSRNEVEKGKSGFAHFFEHMMFRGTEKVPADKYQEIMKNAGADQNAYTTDDYTNYHITFTKADLETIIATEADRFQNLRYTEEQFRTEALAVKGEYLKNFSNPVQKAYERIRQIAFKEHTYRHTTMGFFEDIEEMPNQMEYSKQFFDRWYRPEKTSVILVGDLDAEATFALVEKYWSGWERGDYEVDVPVEPPPEGPIHDHVQWESETQPWLVMGFRGPEFDPNSKAMPSMDLISQLYFEESSETYQKIVIEEKWADQFSAYFPDREDPNLLYLFVRLTDAAHGAAVRDTILDSLVRARTEEVDAERLEATKSRLKYAFASQMDSSDQIGGMLAAYVHFRRTPETINELYRTYDSLSSADLVDHANRIFTDAGRVMVTLSHSEGMPGFEESPLIDGRVAEIVAGQAGKAPVTEAPAAATGAEQEDPVVSAGPVEVEGVAMASESSPLVDVSFLFHAGSAYDPPGKKGLAALTAAMIANGGTRRMTVQEIEQAMYPLAAGFESQVDKEMTRFSGQVHKDNLDAWYALVREQLLTPGWREDDLERLKLQQVNAIRTSLVDNNDEELGKEVLYSFIYGPDHPYGTLNLGVSADVESLTLDDVKAFYGEHYTRRNLSLGLAGGYSPEFSERVALDLGALPEGDGASVALPRPPAIEGSRAIIVEKDAPAVAVSFGFPIALRRGDPDWVALWLVRSWLGEHRSSNSYLYQRIRELRGMNYGDYAYIEYFPRGMFQFQPDANLGRRQQIFQVWLRPLRSNTDAHFATRVAIHELNQLLENGMTEEQFEGSRAFLDKFVSLLLANQSRQLGYGLDSEYYGIEAFTDYVRKELSELTLEDVNRVMREQLRTSDVKFVFVARDAGDLRKRLVSDQPSPIEYNAPKADDVTAEDKVIQALPLGLTEENVRIVPAAELF